MTREQITAPRDVLLAASLRQAHLTAEIDWRWKRVNAGEYEMPGGRRARIATRADQIRGLPRGTVVHFAYDSDQLPWGDLQTIEAMLAGGHLVAGRGR